MLGLGLAGSIPALAGKHHGDHQGAAGKATPEAGRLTAASEVTTAAGKFKTVTRTFSFGHAIDIDLKGPATTYPAVITVSGFKRGRIKDVNVRIPGFSHDFPQDVDLLLVGPQGQQAIIFSDVGGATPTTSPRDVKLDDEATQALTENGSLVSGTFTPINVGGGDEFPAPAPGLNRDEGLGLAVFDGTNPNGAWQLFLVDDANNDGGVLLAPGWTLTITARVRR